MSLRIFFILAVLQAAQLTLAATQVVSGNITFGAATDLGNYGATTLQAPLGDNTSVWFNYSSSGSANTLEVVQWNIDQESDWYLVQDGDVFGVGSIANGSDPVIFTTDNPRPPVELPLGDVYLGVATGQSFEFRDAFGWLHLNNTGNSLEYIDSAVAYDSTGIVVGTLNAVPEPASLQIAGLLMGGFLAFRRT